jgi:4-hydroxybenzoate polyprenyltransferase
MDADAAFRRTLPITAGKKRAATIAIWFVLAAVILSFLPVLILLWDPNYFPKVVLYLPFVFVADAMFIYSCTFVRKDPRKAQSKMKDAMVIAMMAFLVTGFIGIIGPPMRL